MPSGWVAAAAIGIAAAFALVGCDDANEAGKVPSAASTASAARSAQFQPGSGTVDSARYVRLEALSEANGNLWASVAELNVLDAAGAVIPRLGWKATADSEEVLGEDASAAKAIDGDTGSYWHTRWQGSGPPHLLVIDMGALHSVGGFRYLPRQLGQNGRIARWRFATSLNGSSWTQASEGTFPDGAAEVTVRFAAPKGAGPSAAVAAASAAATPVTTNPVRAARIKAFASGPLVAGPAWHAGETVGVDTVRRLASGQHLVYTAAGTTGETEPAPPDLVDGRPLRDGSATAYLNGRLLGTSRADAPGLGSAPNAKAAGLIETAFAAGDAQPPRHSTVHGCKSLSVGTSFIGHYCFASGPATGSGNATAVAAGPQGAQLSSGNAYHANSWEEEFVVTDATFGLVFANSSSPIDVEIDGVQVQAAPSISSGAEGWTMTFDYHGQVRPRSVRVVSAVGSVAPTLRGVALTAQGKVEAGPAASDQLLVLGDSINATITPPSEAGAQMLSYWLQRNLGFDGTINMAVGGAGYISENPGGFNLPHLLDNPANRALIAGYAPSISHVLIGAGFSDRARPAADVRAAALASWKTLRALLPTAKISITDGWSGSSGPDAQALALAALLERAFAEWGDANARLIHSVGTSAATAYVNGSGTAGTPVAEGNSSVYTSTDAVHPSPAGGRYLARRLADDIAAAWSGAY